MKKVLLAFFVAIAMTATASAQPAQFIKTGASLSWKASSGDHGAMKVGTVSGQYFEVEQTNDNNRDAGVQKLYGAILDKGKKIVLLNVGSWKEVWEGTTASDGVSGAITAGAANFTFTISAGAPTAPAAAAAPAAPVSTAPFLPGKTLKWKTNAAGGQNGTFKVTGVNGPTFTLEQKNDKNMAAGIVKMDGELKDGKFFIYNRQWNETWSGALANGVVSGKINNSYTFQIAE